MFKRIGVYLQYFLPQHLLSVFIGWLANSQHIWLKNLLIKNFISMYKVNMSEASEENPEAYACFNDFFIRKLKTELRPIAYGDTHIISPVDGTIAQLGIIQQKSLLTAKEFYFDLQSLLAGDNELSNMFADGAFFTFYLAPSDYHRVHMPVDGSLIKSIYVPGKLFSVNRISTSIIPNIYSRNERYIMLFETNHGRVAVILIGALIVGSINTVWLKNHVRGNEIRVDDKASVQLKQGAELGYFKLGSSVIILFEPGKANPDPTLQTFSKVKLGQFLGRVK